jgi:predicted metalloenzyme YecM
MITDSALHFLDKITALLKESSIEIKNWEIDHLCYRTDSIDHYEEVKRQFSQLGSLLIESEVGGRPIATFKLNKPVIYKNYFIDLVEVPAPKAGRVVQRGFEHIEVVLDCSFEDFIDQYPHFPFQKKGLGKTLNPELEIDFGDCAVKFHHKSLEHIINIESNEEVMAFLDESKLLENLKLFNPLISGTIPLSIENKNSDLDILFSAKSLSQFRSKVQSEFGHFAEFEMKEAIHQDHESLITNFFYKDLKVQFFCSQKNVFQQRANIHFLIEGRLLKLAGQKLRNTIIDLKKQGSTTEEAFGQILQLQNPYQDLLKLQTLTDKTLSQQLNLNSFF